MNLRYQMLSTEKKQQLWNEYNRLIVEFANKYTVKPDGVTEEEWNAKKDMLRPIKPDM